MSLISLPEPYKTIYDKVDQIQENYNNGNYDNYIKYAKITAVALTAIALLASGGYLAVTGALAIKAALALIFPTVDVINALCVTIAGVGLIVPGAINAYSLLKNKVATMSGKDVAKQVVISVLAGAAGIVAGATPYTSIFAGFSGPMYCTVATKFTLAGLAALATVAPAIGVNAALAKVQ